MFGPNKKGSVMGDYGDYTAVCMAWHTEKLRIKWKRKLNMKEKPGLIDRFIRKIRIAYMTVLDLYILIE